MREVQLAEVATVPGKGVVSVRTTTFGGQWLMKRHPQRLREFPAAGGGFDTLGIKKARVEKGWSHTHGFEDGAAFAEAKERWIGREAGAKAQTRRGIAAAIKGRTHGSTAHSDEAHQRKYPHVVRGQRLRGWERRGQRREFQEKRQRGVGAVGAHRCRQKVTLDPTRRRREPTVSRTRREQAQWRVMRRQKLARTWPLVLPTRRNRFNFPTKLAFIKAK